MEKDIVDSVREHFGDNHDEDYYENYFSSPDVAAWYDYSNEYSCLFEKKIWPSSATQDVCRAWGSR